MSMLPLYIVKVSVVLVGSIFYNLDIKNGCTNASLVEMPGIEQGLSACTAHVQSVSNVPCTILLGISQDPKSHMAYTKWCI